MAPSKNPQINYNNNTSNSSDQNASNSSNNCSPNNNFAAPAVTAAAAAAVAATATSTKRKQTGAVPKAGAINASAALPTTIAAATATVATAAAPKTTKRLQQQQQQQHRKNTEIVAPIRRELKDLNCREKRFKIDTLNALGLIFCALLLILGLYSNYKDYLLSTVVSTNNSSNSGNSKKLKSQKLSNNFNKQQQHQQQTFNEANSITAGTAYEIESLHENQRFCYPVRPIPRRNLQQQSQQQQQNLTVSAATSLNANLLNHAATIGVVIPTTPGSAAATSATDTLTAIVPAVNQPQQLQQQLILVQLQQLIDDPQAHSQANEPRVEHNLLPTNLIELAGNLAPATTSRGGIATAAATTSAANNGNLPADSSLAQRLQLIQQFLNLTAKANVSGNRVAAAGAAATATTPTTSTTTTPTARHTQRGNNKLSKSKMVHEINPNTAEREGIVNSASLEDVELSEMSDNRAQSIQSLHSTVETPTPETTPSYDELQQRLEASNRNIQNMQEQQHQLLRLQNAAKQHLTDMEELRQQAGSLSFGPGRQNGTAAGAAGDAPEYESIEQVHSDMATLVGRMKNLTAFIQNQNELGNILGDDGPEILAEQEALQRKLESLRVQRDEMKNLVDELQDINRSAEKSAKDSRNREREREGKMAELLPEPPISPHANERVVPVEYSRTVPIELLQPGQQPQGASDDAEMAALIKQKTADVETMKAQLKRLKDMMETVNLIEVRTANDPREIGRAPQSPAATLRASYDRERTPIAAVAVAADSSSLENDNDAFVSRKMRMLNEVTSDLRAQAENLQVERDRIKALKEEIVRRKEQAAAAAQLGEDALKRHSLTPTPTPMHLRQQQLQQEELQADRDHLKAEYEAKKKEFELLCQRLHSEENTTGATTPVLHASTRQDTVSEADDEADEEQNDSDFANSAAAKKYYASAQRSATVLCLNAAADSTGAAARDLPQQRSGKDSLDSTLESSNAAGATATANNTHDGASVEGASLQSGSSQSYSIPPPMPAMSAWTGCLQPPPLPATWNPHFYYGGSMPPPPPPPHVGAYGGLNGHAVVPQLAAAATTAPPNNNSECICSATNSAATLAGTAPGTASSTASTAAHLNADPMLVQQLVQTQQMLINSVCQCNQMLWHQQREIDALNNTIHVLQERLFALSGPSTVDAAFNLRSESVPPASLPSGALPNNLYAGFNRAQSEQPLPFLPATGAATSLSSVTSYHQQQQHQQLLQQQQQQQQLHQQQQQHIFHQRHRGIIASAGGGYNYSSETQQQNTSNTSTSIYGTLNNAAVQQPPPVPQFNNEAPQSPLSSSAGPGPIFMHHHNNAIHQNNANLRTQNHYANNLQHQQQQHHNNVSNGGGNTLNNQVPPGNRANNYWDNFRSYSRQNLLSTNSNKSNEEQQQQQQVQHTQPEQTFQPQCTALPATNPNPLHHAQQQQQQHNLYHPAAMNNSINCNNLNYDNSSNNASNNNNFMRALQRSRINQLQQQHYQQQQHTNLSNNLYQPNVAAARDFHGNPNWLENNVNEVFEHPQQPPPQQHYNIIDNDMSAAGYVAPASNTTATSMLRNMNVNVGNSPHYQRNKVAAKQPTCRSTTALNRNCLPPVQSQPHLRNVDDDFALPPRQQQHFRANGALPYPSARFSLLPTAAAAAHNLQQNRERDYLLRPVNDVSAIDEDADYDYVLNARLSGGTDSIVVHGFNDREEEDEDDTTSEEIKRNLLVNALKNDKFTTKFYESIKEDVFRRLESMLLEKDNSDHQQEQEHRVFKQPFSVQLVNDVGNRAASSTSATRDPMRKLYLNARMGNQQQRQQQQCCAMQELQVEIDEPEESNNINADTESNNGDHETVVGLEALNGIGENLQPEDEADENELGSLNGAAATSSSADNLPAAMNRCANVAATTMRQDAEQQHAAEVESNSLQQAAFASSSSAAVVSIIAPDYELINYIITRIKNQTHTNTVINDTLLVEVAKLTATAAQNSTTTRLTTAMNAPAHISPKKIYAKIKKLCMPRQRDEFLDWYQNYLTTLFLLSDSEQHVVAVEEYAPTKLDSAKTPLNKHKPQKCNIPKKKSRNEATELVNNTLGNICNNNSSSCGTTNATSLQINDADLAEADQLCSANTSISNNSNMLLQSAELNVVELQDACSENMSATKRELEEFENNENPDDEGAAGASSVVGPACVDGSVEIVPVSLEPTTDEEPQNNDSDLIADFSKRNGVA